MHVSQYGMNVLHALHVGPVNEDVHVHHRSVVAVGLRVWTCVTTLHGGDSALHMRADVAVGAAVS